MRIKYKREDIIRLVSEYEADLKQQRETVRPEVKWLQEKFAGIMKRYGLNSRKETDILIYERMYGRQPERTSDYLKVRYYACQPVGMPESGSGAGVVTGRDKIPSAGIL